MPVANVRNSSSPSGTPLNGGILIALNDDLLASDRVMTVPQDIKPRWLALVESMRRCTALSRWNPGPGAGNEAMHSISTRARARCPLPATVERAGGSSGKWVAYTAFIAWRSAMFVRNTVRFNTRSSELPAAASTALMFSTPDEFA